MNWLFAVGFALGFTAWSVGGAWSIYVRAAAAVIGGWIGLYVGAFVTALLAFAAMWLRKRYVHGREA